MNDLNILILLILLKFSLKLTLFYNFNKMGTIRAHQGSVTLAALADVEQPEILVHRMGGHEKNILELSTLGNLTFDTWLYQSVVQWFWPRLPGGEQKDRADE